MAANSISSLSNNGYSARLMKGRGANTIPGSLGHRSPKKLHGMGRTLEGEDMEEQESKTTPSTSKHSSPGSSPPPSKTSHCKDPHSLWKSVQDCHASLSVANPRHFEFAVANLCFLLKAYGKELDKHVKCDIDRIFQTIRILALDPNKRPTTRMQLLKVIELRARHWDADQVDMKQTASTTETKIKNTASSHDIKSALNIVDNKPTSCTTDMKPYQQPAHCSNSSQSTIKKSETITQPSPKSTGFWDALTYIPEISRLLSPIPEETTEVLSPHHVKAYGDQGIQGTTVGCPGRPYNISSPIDREKQNCLNSSLVSAEGSMFEDGTASLTGPGLSSSRSSPIDLHLGNTVRTRRLSSGSTSSNNHLIQYTRDFLLKCWDSSLCRVMPTALQHTISHSDIYYIIRIPIFEDPTFLLNNDSSPPNIKSAVLSSYPNQCNRRHYPTWPRFNVVEPNNISGPA